MFLSAGLVLSGCGDDDTATTPAPAPPPPPPPAPEPEPEPPAPEAPATPTGLHVDETTETSVTWHWNASEGALGYMVQVSLDEMFDDTDQVGLTQETQFTATPLAPNTTVYLRVRAGAGTPEALAAALAGDYSGLALSDWTTHVTGMSNAPPPPPPPPMAPATPTGFMVESDLTSITWSWDAVEGALGYAIQVSMDEMFDDMDQVALTQETSFTTPDPLPPGFTLFARVASGTGTPEAIAVAVATGDLSGLLLSAWTTHMTGMTMTPPPPPPPMPDPVMVTFSLSEDAKNSDHFLIADDDDDEDTAMAWVNPEIMVESNHDAIITPMFIDGANGVNVSAGSNMPFTYVGAEDNWELSQSDVVHGDGATFMIQRATIGANQEMEPTGDVAYVTCGPFECVDGMDKPEPSIENSTMCTMWDPDVDITAGKVDNDVLDANVTDGDPVARWDGNDGVDIGITTSSSLDMKVKHVFSGVARGTNSETTVDASDGSDKTLAMKAVANVILIGGADTDDTDTEWDDTLAACDNPYTAEDVSSKVDRPGGSNCFRLLGPGAGRDDNDASKGADYLSGWSIELSPVGADVGWGSVDWEDDPFEDLTCGDHDPIMVSDHVDVCEMFEAEVDGATGKGWDPEVVFDTNNRVVMWRAGATAATGHEKMFKTIWFDDNLNGEILEDTTGRGARRPDPDGTGPGTAAGAQATIHDLYDYHESDDNINKIWEFLTDDDGDLVDSAGDLGKVDMVSDSDDFMTEDDETTVAVEACADGTDYVKGSSAATSGCGSEGGARPSDANGDGFATHPDGNADNYVDTAPAVNFADFRGCSEDDGGDDADGSQCDAEWENEVEILFADGTFGCSTTRTVTISCSWNADGGMAVGRNALPNAADLDSAADNTDNNRDHFIKCEAK